jgi:hypothetical protein
MPLVRACFRVYCGRGLPTVPRNWRNALQSPFLSWEIFGTHLRKMRGNLHRPSFSRCAIFEQTCGIERIGTSGCRRPLSTRVCRDKPETSPPPQCLPEVRRMRSRMATDREDGCALAPASTCYLVGVTPCDPAWAADTATGLHVLSRPRLAPWCRATVPNHTRQTPSVANKVKFLRGPPVVGCHLVGPSRSIPTGICPSLTASLAPIALGTVGQGWPIWVRRFAAVHKIPCAIKAKRT